MGPPRTPAEPTIQGIPATRAKVLVVDDDPTIRDLLEQILSGEGFEVRTACDGAGALETLEAWSPALILLDLMMPVMDGWTFRGKQLELDGASAIPVVVLSAGTAIRRHAAALGAASVIEKPFDLGALLDTVGRLVRTE